MKTILSKKKISCPFHVTLRYMHIDLGNIPSFPCPPPNFAIEFLQQGLTTKPN